MKKISINIIIFGALLILPVIFFWWFFLPLSVAAVLWGDKKVEIILSAIILDSLYSTSYHHMPYLLIFSLLLSIASALWRDKLRLPLGGVYRI